MSLMNGPVEAHARDLVDSLWKQSLNKKKRLFNGDLAQDLSHEAYYEYYKHQWHLLAGNAGGRYVSLQTPDSLNQLVLQLDANGTSTHQEISQTLLQGNAPGTSDEARENSINLATRLLLMLKVGVVKHQANPRRYLNWKDGSLKDFVHKYFNTPPVIHYEHIRLPKAFDAWGIFKIAGIDIDFTDNLADHLLLVEDDSKVLIFHHVAFLECQSDQELFPPRLIDETLRTLALLFPQSDYTSRGRRHRSWLFWRDPADGKKSRWFAALRQHGRVLDARLTRCGTLQAEDRQMESFVFWRDRLVVLKQVYDDATPRTLSQWWHDRRNGVQWYTFWVAIVVLIVTTVLSVVQSIEGALQVYKAYHPE